MSEYDSETSAGLEATGLCARCRSVRAQSTKRGAVFYRCARADEDDRFMRYPPIPVRRCAGFEEAGVDEARASPIDGEAHFE